MNETQLIGLELIDPNPWQTRQNEDPAHVDEIAHSIKAMGMMQTPTARKVGDRFQLVFGHTRLAAYKLLETLGQDGYSHFPLVIHDLDDEQMAVAVFEENEKRRDLNPVDRARAVKKMLEDFEWTQEMVAEKLHIDRSGVSNMLRMLRLPQDVLTAVAAGELPVRSAMALIPIFEITTSEQVKLEERFGESLTDFMNGAKKGEVNSDVIRARVDFYMNFLRPEPEQLPFIDGSENDVPMIVENDRITANDEAYEPPAAGQFVEPRPSIPTATQAHIDEWMNHPNEEGEDEPEPSLQHAAEFPAEETDPGSDETSLLGTEQEVQAPQPVPAANHPVEKPALEEMKKDPEDPNAIYLSVSWKTKGVTVSLLKPGWPSPKFRFLNMLKLELLPGVIREMEHS